MSRGSETYPAFASNLPHDLHTFDRWSASSPQPAARACSPSVPLGGKGPACGRARPRAPWRQPHPTPAAADAGRLPRLFEALALARGDGRYARLLKTLSRVDLLILDDWGLAPLSSEQRRDLLEVVDDRHQRGSTIITSQVPIEHWHEVIADPTIADAVLDRLVHNAHRLALKGDSMRKITAQRVNLDATKKS